MNTYNIIEHDEEYITTGDNYDYEADTIEEAIEHYKESYGEQSKFFEVYDENKPKSVLIYRGTEFFNEETKEEVDYNNTDKDYMNDGEHYSHDLLTTIELNEDDQQ